MKKHFMLANIQYFLPLKMLLRYHIELVLNRQSMVLQYLVESL